MVGVGFVMHWLARVFASAVLRRLAALLVVSALAFLGIGHAHAQEYSDQGAAYSACVAQAISDGGGAWNCSGPMSAGNCQYTNFPCYSCYITERYPSGSCKKTNFTFPGGASCDKRSDWNGPYNQRLFGNPRSGTMTCDSGCVQVWTPNADGSYNARAFGPTCSGQYDDAKCKAENGATYYYNRHLNACEPDLPDICPEGQEKNAMGICEAKNCPPGKLLQQDGTCVNEKNECPPGNVKSPAGACLPGDGQCAVGEVKGKDGTCKRDADGDGKPDAGEDEGSTDETFSGGDNCNSPPACSGSPILCGQARIQWRIDCNTRKNRNIAGGACNAMPVCTGDKCDAMEYSGLLMQWRSACALEKLAGKGAGEGDGSQPEWTKVGGMGQDPGAGATPADSPKVGEVEFSTDDLDQSGFGGGSCIGLASGSASGDVGAAYSAVFAAPDASWCLFISRLRASLIVFAAALSCFIIARGAT